MIGTCTAFHHWLNSHGIPADQVTLVVRANGPILAELIRNALTEETRVFLPDVTVTQVRRMKCAGINLVITSLDQSAKVE